MRVSRLVAIAALALGAVACAPAAIQPDLPGCDQTTDFAFAGETTLAALGVRQFEGGQESVRPGMIWVTAGPVEVGGMQRRARWACVRWPDGTGMGGPIADDWQPPPGLVTASGEGSGYPALIAIAVVMVVIGVSVLAFRVDRRSRS